MEAKTAKQFNREHGVTVEDTVMTPYQLGFYHLKPNELKLRIAQDQAEISFKAGEQEKMKEIGNTLNSMQHLPVPGIDWLIDVRMSKEYIENLKAGKYRVVRM